MNNQLTIQWPDHYKPQNCPVHVRNELDMMAPQDRVWAWLIRAPLWPTWYVNSANVKIIEGLGPELRLGTRLRWKTFGVTIMSTVLEYIQNERIAWDAHAFGIDAYHAWVLQPSAKGCHVLTEEAQHGGIARLGKMLMPNRMYKFHQIWLEGLESKARYGFPPDL
jgi:Polyketide cyclase / dehydrase and lipid transport